jgi:hypothetical protein
VHAEAAAAGVDAAFAGLPRNSVKSSNVRFWLRKTRSASTLPPAMIVCRAPAPRTVRLRLFSTRSGPR